MSAATEVAETPDSPPTIPRAPHTPEEKAEKRLLALTRLVTVYRWMIGDLRDGTRPMMVDSPDPTQLYLWMFRAFSQIELDAAERADTPHTEILATDSYNKAALRSMMLAWALFAYIDEDELANELYETAKRMFGGKEVKDACPDAIAGLEVSACRATCRLPLALPAVAPHLSEGRTEGMVLDEITNVKEMDERHETNLLTDLRE